VYNIDDMHLSECDVHVTMHCVKFPITKPTSCTNFSNLFLKWISTCFRQFLCPSSGVFHCTHNNGMLYRFADSLWAGAFAPAHKLSTNLYDIYHCFVYSKKTPDDGQRKCLKHVEFHSKNKFEKLVHLVDFIIRKIPYSIREIYGSLHCNILS